MKTILVAVFALSSLFSFASGTKKKSVASYRTTQSLAVEFGNVDNLKWSTASNNLTRADFTVEDQQVAAFFDEAGEYVASTRVLTFNDLPKKLRSLIQKNIADEKINQILLMSSKDETAYFIETITDGVRKVWKSKDQGDLQIFKNS
jgi:hypothetical protein